MIERIKEVYRNFKDQVRLLSLDINKNQCWKKYNVRTIPTLLYFKHGILVGLQSTFPEKKEIEDKFKSLTKKRNDFIVEIDKSIEAQYLTSQFYKYIYDETKNAKVRTIFFKFYKEAQEHQKSLEQEFYRITGSTHHLDLSKFESEDFRPQSFSLVGALKTAIRTEERAFKIYRFIASSASTELRKIFKVMINNEEEYFWGLKKQLQFLKHQEKSSSLHEQNYEKWLSMNLR